MSRYLSLLFFIGLVFWNCEDEQEPEDCADVAGGDNICGCTNSTAPNYDSTATHDDGSCVDTIEIIYNIHDSLPADWITEFYVIMNNLLNIIPSYQNYFSSITIYAWNDNIDSPYSGIQGGAYVGGEVDSPIMVMEIPSLEFTYGSMHRFSVIAHEYFHIYQRSLSEPMNQYNNNPNGIDIKWLIEGAAASFESIYIRNNYNYNYFGEQSHVDSMVKTDPSIFESYDSNEMDINYSSSVFMTLVLAKELIKLNYSEENAFKLIYKDFMLATPTNLNWATTFESVFNITVSDFYKSVKTYPVNLNEVLPSDSLKIKQIFD